jgi:hypothetical protein
MLVREASALPNRLASIDNTGISGVPAVKLNYGYDTVGNTVTVGDLIANVSAGLLTYSYDVLNRSTSISQTGTGVQNKHIDMTYNAISQVIKLSRFRGASSAVETTYGYDSSQWLTQIAHKQGCTGSWQPLLDEYLALLFLEESYKLPVKNTWDSFYL